MNEIPVFMDDAKHFVFSMQFIGKETLDMKDGFSFGKNAFLTGPTQQLFEAASISWGGHRVGSGTPILAALHLGSGP